MFNKNLSKRARILRVLGIGIIAAILIRLVFSDSPCLLLIAILGFAIAAIRIYLEKKTN